MSAVDTHQTGNHVRERAALAVGYLGLDEKHLRDKLIKMLLNDSIMEARMNAAETFSKIKLFTIVIFPFDSSAPSFLFILIVLRRIVTSQYEVFIPRSTLLSWIVDSITSSFE